MTMSPPQRAGSSLSLGNFGRVGQRAGRWWRCRTGRAVLTKNPGPNPTSGSAAMPAVPRASPVSAGAVRGLRPTAPSAAAPPAVIRSAIVVHSRSIATTSGFGIGGDVEGAVVHPVLGGSDDPALVAAAERHWFVQSTAGGAGGSPRRGKPGSPAPAAPITAGGDPGRARKLRRDTLRLASVGCRH